MKLKYNCFICLKYCFFSLEYMKKNKLFLNFDNDREHRPICIECKKILEPLLVAECFTNPFERLNEKKPKTLIKELDLKGLEKWF